MTKQVSQKCPEVCFCPSTIFTNVSVNYFLFFHPKNNILLVILKIILVILWSNLATGKLNILGDFMWHLGLNYKGFGDNINKKCW